MKKNIINYKKEINDEKFLKNQILKLTKEYVCKYGNNKNSNTINVTGKVIDHCFILITKATDFMNVKKLVCLMT